MKSTLYPADKIVDISSGAISFASAPVIVVCPGEKLAHASSSGNKSATWFAGCPCRIR